MIIRAHLVAALVAYVVAGASSGQGGGEPAASPESLAAEAREKLGSKEVAEVAWGADAARRSGIEDLTPDLLRALATLRGDDDRHRWARRALLSALIELRADVPTPELRRLLPKRATEVLVLAARRPRDHVDLLVELASGVRDRRAWTAAHNLLLTVAPPRLAPLLLSELSLRLELQVVEGQYGLGGSSSRGHGAGRLKVPADFPPITAYLLTESPRGAELLADGPFPIHLKRTVGVPGKTTGIGSSEPGFTHDARRLRYLEELLGRDHDLLSLERQSISWVSDEHYLKRATELRADVLARWQQMVADLVGAGLLDAAASRRAVPRLEVTVKDRRRRRGARPLPGLPALGASVRIGSIDWFESYDQAMVEARRANKPLLLHFGENPG